MSCLPCKTLGYMCPNCFQNRMKKSLDWQISFLVESIDQLEKTVNQIVYNSWVTYG